MPARTNGPKTADALEKTIAKENWFKLVVKIISWKDANQRGSIQLGNKITSKEWDAYTKGMLANNVTHGKQTVLEKLKETRQIIQELGGFE